MLYARHSLNNPVKYTDPSGHAVICGVADEGCGDYQPHPAGPTAPPDAVNNTWNFATSVAVAVGTAFVGGSLIGAGSNLIRAAFVTGKTTTGLIGSGLVGAGTGVLVGDGATVVSAAISGQELDPKDILISSATTGTAGFFTGLTSGVSTIAALIYRATVNATVSATASGLSDAAHGRPINWGKAALSGGLSAVAGTIVDTISSALNPTPKGLLGASQPYSSLAKFVGNQQAQKAATFGFFNALAIQGPLTYLSTWGMNSHP